jgi:EAL domain-containing protein (putative c-di-GMP-specific phosphodiesterase class I)
MTTREPRVDFLGSGALPTPPTPALSTTLLLAPLDPEVDRTLNSALTSQNLPFERHGIVYAVPDARAKLDSIRGLLTSRLFETQQCRIKAVFGVPNAEQEGMLAQFLRAEPLPSFFELAEVEWAREALTDGSLCSVFHPILDARSGLEWGYEALIRARRPNGEVIGAGQLLYACERLNLQYELDLQARLTCIRESAALKRPHATFFINFLPTAVGDPSTGLRSTFEAVEAAGISMSQLVFEVVESERLPSMDQLRRVLDTLREHGAKVALDDIASGFSSLQLLADLHPDFVKVDRMLVSCVGHSSSSKYTLQAIVELAAKLNVKVIAEGVETYEQLDVCRSAGVDYVQGFLFALPENPPANTRAAMNRWWPLAA